MSERKLPVKNFVADIENDLMGFFEVMQKYQLTYPQLILALAQLAKAGLIRPSILIDALYGLVEIGNLASARKLYDILQQKFPGIRGMKRLGSQIDWAEQFRDFMVGYNERLAEPSKALKEFETSFPGIPLHREVKRQIKFYEMFYDKMPVMSFDGPLVDISSRFNLVVANNDSFKGISDIQANRMWHYLALKMFAQNGVEQFLIFNPMDMLCCGTCVTVAHFNLGVKEVLTRVNKDISCGRLVTKRPFPTHPAIDNMPIEEKKRILLKKGWYLPPFCNDCRCQVFPFL